MFFGSVRHARREEGFTLIELLITVVILGIIMAIAAPIYLNQKDKSQSVAAKTQVATLSQFVADGLALGAMSGYTGTADGVTPLTGVITTDVGSQRIGDALFYYDATVTPQTWCISDQAGSAIWMSTSTAPIPVIATGQCTTATSGPTSGLVFSYDTGGFTQGVNNEGISPTISGGSGAKTYSITSGALPSGVTFNTATGVFTGPLASAWNLTPASVSMVASGTQNTCVLTTVGGVKCWGSNSNGQLGNGTTADSNVPVQPTGLTSGVASVSSGFLSACAVTTAGGAKCWGLNNYGQLGNGTTTDSNVPVDVTGLSSGVASIVTSGQNACAIMSAGALKCWGYGFNGQLGNGSTTDSNVPVNVTGLSSGVASVSIGVVTCAVTTAGAAKCWGYNGLGAIGDGTTTSSNIPVAVSGLSSGVASISSGTQSTCAITTGGGVKCWGQNTYGELGNGTTTDSNVPVNVTGLSSGVAAVSVANHTCAVTTSGAAKCWGTNGGGELGNGNNTDSLTPVGVSGLSSGVASISATDTATCVTTASNTVKCWGSNGDGEFADGTINSSNTPVNARIHTTQVGYPAYFTVQITDSSGTSTANIMLMSP